MSDPSRIAVVFDLDFTITTVDTYPIFLRSVLLRRPHRLFRAGFFLLDLVRFRMGARDNSWLKERALTAVAGNAPSELIANRSRAVVDLILRSKLRRTAVESVERHRRAGHYLILATASFDCYARPLATQLGFDAAVCSIFRRDERSCITGQLSGKNCYGEEKVRRVIEVLNGQRENWHVIAYTDHESDLPLLEWADEKNVVNPTKRMRRLAMERQYPTLSW